MYLVQPRRIAARSVAERIAQERGERLGDRIGYAVRFEQRVSAQTDLIVATEGILIRRLQHDPTFQETSIVVLDEFHERSLDGDLLLGMLRRIQGELREDLRIVIMSATLDKEWFGRLMPGVPIYEIGAKSFPVRIEYRPAVANQNIVEHASAIAGEVAENRPGDVLVFLPGAGEINRCCQALRSKRSLAGIDIVPLYGSMRMEEQAQAIVEGERRRIIVATNIAETSLTIPGVQTVIDSGLARVLRFHPGIGLDRLVLENISAASATQRAGRAGRVGPGVCIRLWSEISDRARIPFLEPEIRRVDLSGARLQLFAWGEGTSDDFPWLESPRADAWDAAKGLLEVLGAVNDDRITTMGQRMSALPLHPRLARLCLDAIRRGCLPRAALLAAMLSERDPFDRRGGRLGGPRGSEKGIATHTKGVWESDCVERVHWLEKGRADAETPFGILQGGGLRTIEQVAQQITRQAVQVENEFNEELVTSDGQRRVEGSDGDRIATNDDATTDDALMRCLLAGFPDRLAKRRSLGKPQGLMVGGKGVRLGPESCVRDPEYFLCVDVEGSSGDAEVRQASGVRLEWLQGPALSVREEMFFHPTQKQVVGRRRTYWLDLCIAETPVSIRDEEACAEALLRAVKANWDDVFPKDNPQVAQFIARMRCLRSWLPELELPEVDSQFLERVAAGLCRGKRGLNEVREGAWMDWLLGSLSSEQVRAIDKEAPERIQVPSGSSIRIEYSEGKPPVLAVKIQEVFSWKETPKLARGRIPLLLHLLAPNGRPQQITEDLASFWRSGYSEVKKELKRRYPKHSWPEDPWTAQPTRR